MWRRRKGEEEEGGVRFELTTEGPSRPPSSLLHLFLDHPTRPSRTDHLIYHRKLYVESRPTRRRLPGPSSLSARAHLFPSLPSLSFLSGPEPPHLLRSKLQPRQSDRHVPLLFDSLGSQSSSFDDSTINSTPLLLLLLDLALLPLSSFTLSILFPLLHGKKRR